MFSVRLGYACINVTLGPRARTSRTCRISNATPHRLEDLARANLVGLAEVLRWNMAHKIKVFRISSGIIPLASHPLAQWPWKERLSCEISSIGDYAKEHNLRLSMHPGQYTVLNSPKKEVLAASKAELSYHAELLDEMGLSSQHKVILHVGGVYGDRETSLRRFQKNFRMLPRTVRNRLAIENDERSYDVDSVLNLCNSLDMPMVFDYLHYKAYNSSPLRASFLDQVYSTWTARDGRPELHYSTQRRRARKGAHADTIDTRDFMRFLKILPKHDIDVMLEAKAKDAALIRLRNELRSRWSLTDVIIE